MKKISTAAAKQTRNFQDQKLTIGLDLGDRTSWVCVLNPPWLGRARTPASRLILSAMPSSALRRCGRKIRGSPRRSPPTRGSHW